MSCHTQTKQNNHLFCVCPATLSAVMVTGKLASFCPEVFYLENDENLKLHEGWMQRPPWVRVSGSREQWTYCTDCMSWVSGKDTRRVPMRNAFEMLRTRLYTDKLRAELYAHLSENVGGLPSIPSLDEGQQKAVLKRHLMHYIAIRKAAEADVSELFRENSFFTTPEDFWKAVYAEMGVVRNTNPGSVLGFVERSSDAEVLKDFSKKLSDSFQVKEYFPEACLCPDTNDQEYWTGKLVAEEWYCLQQHAPDDVPFEHLRSQEAKSAVSVCRLWSHLRSHRPVGKPGSKSARQVPTFTHVSGNVQTKAKFPYEDMGFFGIVAMNDEEREKTSSSVLMNGKVCVHVRIGYRSTTSLFACTRHPWRTCIQELDQRSLCLSCCHTQTVLTCGRMRTSCYPENWVRLMPLWSRWICLPTKCHTISWLRSSRST